MLNFDSHQFVKDFQKAKSKEEEAEVIYKSFITTRDNDLSKLASKDQFEDTKNQLDNLKMYLEEKITAITSNLNQKIEDEIKVLREELNKEIKSAEVSRVKWNVTTLIAIVGILITLFQFLPH